MTASAIAQILMVATLLLMITGKTPHLHHRYLRRHHFCLGGRFSHYRERRHDDCQNGVVRS